MDVSSVKLECAISSGWKLDVRMVCGPPKHNPNKILFLSISFDIISPTKVYTVKAMVFLVVTYGCKSRTIKKTERWRIDAFELWCYRRLLRVPWTTRRSNQSILKEINLEYLLEGMMLKLKLQYFGHLMQSWLSGKHPIGWKDWGQEEKWMTKDGMVGWHHWLNGHEFEQTLGDGEEQENLVCCSAWCFKELDTT